MNIGSEYDGDVFLMYRLVKKRFHPEIGVATDGWIYGAGYDLNEDMSLDLYMKKDFNLKGRPTPQVGISFRF